MKWLTCNGSNSSYNNNSNNNNNNNNNNNSCKKWLTAVELTLTDSGESSSGDAHRMRAVRGDLWAVPPGSPGLNSINYCIYWDKCIFHLMDVKINDCRLQLDLNWFELIWFDLEVYYKYYSYIVWRVLVSCYFICIYSVSSPSIWSVYIISIGFHFD